MVQREVSSLEASKAVDTACWIIAAAHESTASFAMTQYVLPCSAVYVESQSEHVSLRKKMVIPTVITTVFPPCNTVLHRVLYGGNTVVITVGITF